MSFKPPKEGSFLPLGEWDPSDDDPSEFALPDEPQEWHPPAGLRRPSPEELELRERRLASWPEPPDTERYAFKGEPFQLFTVTHTPNLPHGPFPSGTTGLTTLSITSQADLEQAERECRGLPDFSIRQQLSMMCDQQPQSVGLLP